MSLLWRAGHFLIVVLYFSHQEMEQQFEKERTSLEEQKNRLREQLDSLREELTTKLNMANSEVRATPNPPSDPFTASRHVIYDQKA